jgi:hypothetical protein
VSAESSDKLSAIFLPSQPAPDDIGGALNRPHDRDGDDDGVGLSSTAAVGF